ncbi:putative permease domain protein [Pedobacter sp. BAL39]|uniref:ABC transporter permease n=1 Tax=Pedobacter sp. BAL39 TaxID=391596 RepID=UPI000155A0C1|nr:FtsX-like permease family protein [Pedobacter sp. BAL39]EDM38435.1 putative permease domain protein [Pedobacter sp. BAL39]
MSDTKLHFNRKTNYSWLFRMAWRDSRRNRSRLLLFISSIILGIAALVAIYAFRDNLQRDIDEQAKELTGADLIIESRKPVKGSTDAVLDTIGERRAKERSFASMVYFLKNSASRLIQVRALEGAYPFYGEIGTSPANAASTFQQGRNALVDQTLLMQYGAAVGDSIKIGALNFAIAGSLERVPGQSGITSAVAPVVYIPLKYLEKTGLHKIGSRITYRYYYKFYNDGLLTATLKKLGPLMDKEGLDHETVATKKAGTGRAFNDLNRFLALSGFVALLLGCIGVGSSVQVYIKEKLSAIATLRCLGMNAREAFIIYLIQIVAVGFIGALAGAALGTLIQFGLPALLADFIPIEIQMRISWSAIGQGLVLGVVIALLFALPSLLEVRRISPLNAIRASFESSKSKSDPVSWVVYLFIILFIYGFSYLQLGGWIEALFFIAAITVAFGSLYGLSKAMMWLTRKAMRPSMSYLWRQGFANLYRPNNQTVMLIVAIGLSTTLIALLYFVQVILINKVSFSSSKNQPNMVLFDIQSAQKEALATMTRQHQLPVMSQVPIVTMRIEEVNGKTAAELAIADSLAGKKDQPEQRGEGPQGRAFRGEIRASYQQQLTSAERVVAGQWTGSVKPGSTAIVSLEQQYAERIHVNIGDTILFNVQGMLIPAVVGSLREVDWNRMQTNFRVVFSGGVLEKAPQFSVLMTRVPSKEASAKYQADVVNKFPNISMIDLGLVLQVLDDLLGKIGFVIRFMAGFSMATGWVVLLSAVMASKGQRQKETVLLRTLGASRRQLNIIIALEYLFLGMLASATGIVLAMAGAWAIATFSLKASFSPDVLPVIAFFIAVTLLVMLTGLYNSRKIFNHSPLEILRKES